MKFDWIVNKLKERIYPYTHADAVIMDDDNTKLSEKFAGVDEHIEDTALHVPTDGIIGQVLTKTVDGNNWTTVPSGEDGGTTDYTLLENLPQINDVTLIGNKSLSNLGITATAIGVEEGANNYVHPITSGNKHIPAGGGTGQILRWSADGTAVWGSDNDTLYSNATTSESGLMSNVDKTKLDGLPNIEFRNEIPTTLPENTICFVYE